MPELLQATPDDWSAIAELVAAAYGRWVPVLGRSPKPMTVDYPSAINHHRFDLLTTRTSWSASLKHASSRTAFW